MVAEEGKQPELRDRKPFQRSWRVPEQKRGYLYLWLIRRRLIRLNSISALLLFITDFQSVIHWAKASFSELSPKFASGGSDSSDCVGLREGLRLRLGRVLFCADMGVAQQLSWNGSKHSIRIDPYRAGFDPDLVLAAIPAKLLRNPH